MSPILYFISIIFTIATVSSQVQSDVTANCRTAPGLQRHLSTSTLAPPMDPTCIAINLTLNVENILADPSYIIPQENIEVVQTALQQTLNYYGISPTISSLPSTLPTTWTVNNECPAFVDNTANKYNFIPVHHDITVDPSSLDINYGSNHQTVEMQWQFTTPSTIVYDFNAQSLSSLIPINCMGYSMKAYIVDLGMLIVAESTIFSITNNMDQQVQQMNFVNIYAKLESNSVYSLYIYVFNMFQCINNQPEVYWTSMPTTASPVISILAEPSSCRLAHSLRDTQISGASGFAFGINALCQEALSTASRKLFERALYQQHSSNTELTVPAVPQLPVNGLRRRMLNEPVPTITAFCQQQQQQQQQTRRRLGRDKADWNWCKLATELEVLAWPGNVLLEVVDAITPPSDPMAKRCAAKKDCKSMESLITELKEKGHEIENLRIIKCDNGCRMYDKNVQFMLYPNSLHLLSDSGVDTLVAPDTVFPYNDQCITMNPGTLRLFSVGGQNKLNGAGLSAFNVYDLLGQTQPTLSEQFELSEPRAYGRCQYYKNVFNGNREYIMIINGVKDIRDIINIDLWYNDIIFIPLDYNERLSNNLPKIKLKHAVIDPALYVTDSNELYIFGGRDGLNAKNYIQYIDLNVVFSSASTDILTTMDRFEPMRLNRVSPLIDTRTLKAGDIYDKCMLIFGGQDFVNDEFIDTETPPNGLQMYCNQLDPTTAASTIADAEFTSFDINNLQKVDDFISPSSNVRTISINKYNFINDDILYQFTTSSKACFESEEQIKSAETLFKDTMFQNILSYNIVLQSRRRFNGWNNGFGTIYGIDIQLAKPLETIADIVDVNTLCPALSELSCNSKVNSLGVALCKYNVNDNICFGI